MYNKISILIQFLLHKKVPAVGIGVFRILYGLVTFQEIIFLYYFRHLIFDPIPFIDVEFPTIPMFLVFWGVIALFIIAGYRYQLAVLCNYFFWIVFINFTPMQRDFDGGFDLFMVGAGFFLLFMPGDRSLSLDKLRSKLGCPFKGPCSDGKPETVTVLAYYIPIVICLGFLYFDSAIHKLFAEHWRNGLGSWLPSTQPYYVSALDMSWLLNSEGLEKIIGYTILLFQFTFVFLCAQRQLRIFYLLFGMALHLGITLSLNIYPFGLAMLMFYTLLMPDEVWQRFSSIIQVKQPKLTVFYDRDCPLCNRTATILNHFDICRAIVFKNVQDYAVEYPVLAKVDQAALLTDLYAVDQEQQIYCGVGTYLKILTDMRWPAPLAWLAKLPILRKTIERRYRIIADNRRRLPCTDACMLNAPSNSPTWYQWYFDDVANQKPKLFSRRLAKLLIAILLLQINSTVHYGLVYRFDIDTKQNVLTDWLAKGSNAIISVSQTFLGIAPHALYLHDHFSGYDRILAITYTDTNGIEQWLPFVNEQGRLLAPNWGRVHSMWANIAVTPTIDEVRLKKFIMKVTAFWGRQLGLNLNNTVFHIQMKRIDASSFWVYDQLHKNFNAPWITIGTATWANHVISYDLPKNINTL